METSSKLLINEPALQILPSLAVAIGLNEAIVLQQVHYWLAIAQKGKDTRKFVDGRWWVYNTYEEWGENFPWWSIDTVRRAIRKLEADHLLISREMNAKDWDHTKWYTIDYDVLNALPDLRTTPNLIGAACTDRNPQEAPILIESETTTKTTSHAGEISSTLDASSETIDPKAIQAPNPADAYRERARLALAHGMEAQQQDELPGVDLTGFPADVVDIIREVCKVWGFRTPLRKGDKARWIEDARALKHACGEFGLEPIKRERLRVVSHMRNHGGVSPYTFSGPGSLVNTVAAMAAQMRSGDSATLPQATQTFVKPGPTVGPNGEFYV